MGKSKSKAKSPCEEKPRYRQHKAEFGIIYPGLSEVKQGEAIPVWLHQHDSDVSAGKEKWVVNTIFPGGGLFIQSEQGKKRKFMISSIDLVKLAVKMGLDDPKLELKVPEA